eukprot:15457273-Alexandrium_andersonii.AAC.1
MEIYNLVGIQQPPSFERFAGRYAGSVKRAEPGRLEPIAGHDLCEFFRRRPESKAGGMDACSSFECKVLPECALDLVASLLNGIESSPGVQWPRA